MAYEVISRIIREMPPEQVEKLLLSLSAEKLQEVLAGLPKEQLQKALAVNSGETTSQDSSEPQPN